MEQANILVSLRDGHTFEALSVGPMRGKFITFFIPGDRQREVHEDCIRDVEKPSTEAVYDLSALRARAGCGSVITTDPPTWEYYPPDPNAYTPDTFNVRDVPITTPPYHWVVGSHVDAHAAGSPAPLSHGVE